MNLLKYKKNRFDSLGKLNKNFQKARGIRFKSRLRETYSKVPELSELVLMLISGTKTKPESTNSFKNFDLDSLTIVKLQSYSFLI